MHIKTFALNTHDARQKTFPKLPILTFSLSTAPHSSNLIPFSAAFWLPKGLTFVTQHPLRFSSLFLSYAFLTPPMLQKLPFLQAYFVGWELRVSSTADPPLHDFDRLHPFVFSSDSNTFQYSFLLQLVCPPPSSSNVWSLPLHLKSYRDLQIRYPSLLLFDFIASVILDCTIYQPCGNYFTSLHLTTSTLPFWISSLFEPQEDDLMWTLADPPTFSGYFPFMIHVQFWLFVHRCYQDWRFYPG